MPRPPRSLLLLTLPCTAPYAVLFAVLCAGLGAAAPAAAQTRASLLLEAGQGPLLSDGRDPYSASVRLHPGVFLGQGGRFFLSATGGALYTNPGWAGLAGGRAGLRVHRFGGAVLQLGALYLAAEAAAGTEGHHQTGGALILDAGEGVFGLTLRGAYDHAQEAARLELALGTDLWLWLRPREPEDPFAR